MRLKKKTLLYFYVGKSTFIEKDLAIFRESFSVYEFNFITNAKWKNTLLFIRQLFFLFRHVSSANLLVSHFSGYHSFLPALFAKLTKRKFLIIAGGTDCHSFPSIGYGNFQKLFLGMFTKWSYSLCSHISPKHKTLWECEYSYDDKDFKTQGIHAFMPSLVKDITVIPNGYDSAAYHKTKQKKERSVLCIGGSLHYPFQEQLKGIDLILQLAEIFKDCTFTIVGSGFSEGNKKFPPNVSYIPPQSVTELIDIFSAHTFYFQLSMAEGFPNSLCEAMLCECVPVGSAVFSIPEIIGDTGFILPKRELHLLSDIFNEALTSDTNEMGRIARRRIIEKYPFENRKIKLLELCNSLSEMN